MNFSEIFIRRPIATSLLMFAIAIFGVLSYHALAVADLPSVDFPTLSVSASLPGASPATMASAVATPLERQFSSISGVESMTSVSTQGGTSISLQFDLGRSIDGAAVDLVTAINAATPLLPPGMPSPPSFRKSNPADSPIAFLGLTSATLPLWTLNDYAETLVAQRISAINGVAQVGIFGAPKFAVHIQVDPSKLAARQIGISSAHGGADAATGEMASLCISKRSPRSSTTRKTCEVFPGSTPLLAPFARSACSHFASREATSSR